MGSLMVNEWCSRLAPELYNVDMHPELPFSGSHLIDSAQFKVDR